MPTILIVALVLLLIVGWAILMYNGLVRGRNMVREGWSGIDVQLKRRANLIPNLVETVKGYAAHEKKVLEDVTEMRAKSLNAGSVAEQSQAEGLLGRALGRLFAVAENYPDLKANQNYQELQKQLETTENQIEMSRRYYNGTARDYNIKVESFPSSVIAKQFHFTTAQYFELEDDALRAVPQVSFGSAIDPTAPPTPPSPDKE